MSNQSARQATVRSETGTELDYNGDWHALFDNAGIAAGNFNERMLAWINQTLGASYTSVPAAMQAFAEDQGVANWDSLGAFILAVSAASGAALLAAGEDEALVLDFLDNYFYSTTSFYGSAFIKDLGTPANDYNSSPTQTASSLLTYTAPSLKMTRKADGNLAFQAHNLFLQSDTFNVTWASVNVTASATNVTAAGSGTAARYFIQSITHVSGVGYAVSFEIKNDGQQFIQIYNNGDVGAYCNFDVNNGIVGNAGSLTTASISAVVDGYYKCTLQVATSAALAAHWRVAFVESNTATYGASSTAAVIGRVITPRKFHLRRTPSADTYLATTTSARYALPLEWDAAGAPLGLLVEEARTNSGLYGSNLTNAVWSKTSATAALTATGPDGVANSATTLTATANNGTALQRFTSASAARSGQFWLKRRTGTGAVSVAIGEKAGVNLLADGTFTSGVADWTASGSGTITHTGSAGLITAGAATGSGAYAAIATTAGKLYRYELTVTLGTATIVDVALANTAALATSLGASDVSVAGTVTAIGYAFATTSTIALTVFPRGIGNTCTIDNAEIFEVAESTIDLSGGNWVKAKIENKTITNPCLAIKVDTNTDAVDVALCGVEAGSTATSPIPTIGSTVTRAADNISIATSGMPFGASSTVFADVMPGTLPSFAAWVGIDSGATSSRTYLRSQTTALAASSAVTAVDQYSFLAGSLSVGTSHKAALVLATNDFSLVVDGGTPQTDASGTWDSTVTFLRLGNTLGSSTLLNGHIRKLMYLPRRMSNGDMQTLTGA